MCLPGTQPVDSINSRSCASSVIHLDVVKNKFIYPDSERIEPLEYDWNGYREVWLFGSSERLDTVAKWYQENLKEFENQSEESDLLDLFLYEGDSYVGSVQIVDTVNGESHEEIDAFVGSKILKNMLADKQLKTVGVVFIDE